MSQNTHCFSRQHRIGQRYLSSDIAPTGMTFICSNNGRIVDLAVNPFSFRRRPVFRFSRERVACVCVCGCVRVCRKKDADVLQPLHVTRPRRSFKSPPLPCVRSNLQRGWSNPSRCRTTIPPAPKNNKENTHTRNMIGEGHEREQKNLTWGRDMNGNKKK